MNDLDLGEVVPNNLSFSEIEVITLHNIYDLRDRVYAYRKVYRWLRWINANCWAQREYIDFKIRAMGDAIEKNFPLSEGIKKALIVTLSEATQALHGRDWSEMFSSFEMGMFIELHEMIKRYYFLRKYRWIWRKKSELAREALLKYDRKCSAYLEHATVRDDVRPLLQKVLTIADALLTN